MREHQRQAALEREEAETKTLRAENDALSKRITALEGMMKRLNEPGKPKSLNR